MRVPRRCGAYQQPDRTAVAVRRHGRAASGWRFRTATRWATGQRPTLASPSRAHLNPDELVNADLKRTLADKTIRGHDQMGLATRSFFRRVQ
ncbi:hypothetical protein ACFYUD_32650 [Nocardia tengchongensis]|uniref:hypothetical protein n=1 Tax=Nocardia tengchongensis TaxID=2055889 RepID=UPI0036C3F16B